MDKLSDLARQQQAVHKQLTTCKTERDQKLFKERIEILDKQINAIVQRLYELTDAEWTEIEAASKNLKSKKKG